MESTLNNIISNALTGDRRSLGRLLSYIEEDPLKTSIIINELMGKGGRSHVIGVTGIPGSGKSTLISKLITAYRKEGYKVAVIAVDPTSPYSQGALLGDRIRMQEHATDTSVFIRSVSTRGLKGGLSLAALAMIEVFDAMGYDKILIESVGVGQADVDIMYAAHTLLVVTMPGVGDEIQALKAGVMEIGDIYVLNKSDKPEAARTYEYLDFALEAGELRPKGDWLPKIIKTSAIMGRGISDLIREIDEHYNYLIKSGLYREKILIRRKFMLKLLIEKIFLDRLDDIYMQNKLPDISGVKDLYEVAREVIRNIANQI